MLPYLYVFYCCYKTTCTGFYCVGVVVYLYVCDVCKVVFNETFRRLVAFRSEAITHAAHLRRVVSYSIFFHNAVCFRCVPFVCALPYRCRAQRFSTLIRTLKYLLHFVCSTCRSRQILRLCKFCRRLPSKSSGPSMNMYP